MKKIHVPAEGNVPSFEVTLPEGFSVGFSRIDITPDEYPIRTFGERMAEAVHSRVYTTCVAVSDGENLAFFLTSDLRAAMPAMAKTVKDIAFRMTGTTEDQIFYCTTHNHSGPNIGGISYDEVIIRWVNWYYTLIPGMFRDALLDLAPAKITIGQAEGQAKGKPLNFARRYFLADGSFWGVNSGNFSEAPFVSHETIADPVMRVIRFIREGKKDIVMANWQAHAASDANLRPKELTADYVHELRKTAEERHDIHFAYYNGACGDVVTGSKIPGEQPYETMDELGVMLADVLTEALENMQPANAGPIRYGQKLTQIPMKDFSEETLAHAREITEIEDPKERREKYLKYGFQARLEANSVLNTKYRRDTYGGNYPMRITAISFGDIGFTMAPYEMFHANATQVRNASGFPMTFVCSNTDDAAGYIHSLESFPNRGYEVYNCSFLPGTGEQCAEIMIDLLRKTKQ